ncbi:hypothetical protein C7441_11538 [Pseudaminobacter salicylatoxidans]|uniref:DUF945 domain-containing protein n=1 Tax=Pseudaminobacter salicylatoxidans TaxID=93369 RepID=A0A316BYB3_PSESE|nr:hypothetical protein [Pseudaminobacter salicylatoxidans]PWJ79429.1 hypothetical protein C7441_11538 [Pseudaminobacter salicylatoxidans]
MIRSTFQKLALSTFLISMPLQAYAQDAAAVADRLKELLAAQSMDMDWQAVSGDTSKMVLEGVTLGTPGENERLSIGNVTFEGVAEENGGYRIDTVSTEPYRFTEDKTDVELSPLVLSGVSLPAAGSSDVVASMLMYDSASLASLDVKSADKPVFSLSNLSVEVTPPKDGKAMEFTGSVEKFTADLSGVEDPQSKAVLDGLGYRNISGYIEAAGSWQPSDGTMSLSQYDVTVDNAGTLGLTFGMGGYTPAFLKSMQDLQKKIAEQPETDNSTLGLAALGLMQQLTLQGATIRFDDDSLTGKVLDYMARQQGVKPSDIANQAKAIVPFLTAQLNNPELSGQITAAVGQFLDEPQSIAVKAEPGSPVPFALIAAGAMSAPLELPKTLGVTVRANEE